MTLQETESHSEMKIGLSMIIVIPYVYFSIKATALGRLQSLFFDEIRKQAFYGLKTSAMAVYTALKNQ